MKFGLERIILPKMKPVASTTFVDTGRYFLHNVVLKGGTLKCLN